MTVTARWAALAIFLLASVPAAAQTGSSSPGPYVIDLRGAMSGVPQALTFYPAFPLGTTIPRRGFGFDAGGHVYPLRVGAARIGFGANLLLVRGTSSTVGVPAAPTSSTTTTGSSSSASDSSSTGTTTTPVSFPDVTVTTRIIAPQASVNFGDRDGWSYLSAGYDLGTVASRGSGTPALSYDSGLLKGPNFGGGARWFLRERVAFGFDLRFHRLPGAHLFAATVGVSVR